MSLIKAELMEILVCPADKGDLKELESERKLECSVCGRRYPVKNGIPVMLIDEAKAKTPSSENDKQQQQQEQDGR